jgi:Sec-independent protein translocase protein TatA
MTDVALLLLVILGFALLFRGPKTLPKLGGMFGRGVKQVRDEAAELTGGTKTDEPELDQTHT